MDPVDVTVSMEPDCLDTTEVDWSTATDLAVLEAARAGVWPAQDEARRRAS